MGVIIILNLGIEEIVTITVAISEEREVEASSKKSNLRLIHRWNEEETFVDIEISRERNFPFFVASLFVNIARFERQTKPVFFSSRILPKITRYPMDWITDLISSGSERVERSE